MPRLPINGATNESYSSSANAQRTMNWYPETDTTGKNKVVLYPTPGTFKAVTFANGGAGYGLYEFNGKLYVLSGAYMYELTTTTSTGYTQSEIASSMVGPSAGPGGHSKFADNGVNAPGQELLIVNGGHAYLYDIGTSEFVQVDQSDSGTTTATTANKLEDSGATWAAGAPHLGTKVFNTTDSTSTTVTAVDSGTVLSLADDIFTTGEDYSIGSPNFPVGADSVTFFDGYFIVNDPDGTTGQTGAFMWSASYDGKDWAALDFATAERTPDKLNAVIAINKTLYLLGESSIELWYNSGSATNPFKPQTTLQVGVTSSGGVVSLGDIIYFEGTSSVSDGGTNHRRIYAIQGSRVKIVSTYAIENIINDLGSFSEEAARMYAYEENGHQFIGVNYFLGNTSLVFDVQEDAWHERSYDQGSTDESDSAYQYVTNYLGRTVAAGVATTKTLLDLGTKNYTDWSLGDGNGVSISRERVTTYIHNDNYDKLRHKRVVLEFEQGEGIVEVTPQTEKATGITANKLVDISVNFIDKLGITTAMYVHNIDDDTTANITAVDSNTQLTLDADIFLSTDNYKIYSTATNPTVTLDWSDDEGVTWKGSLSRELAIRTEDAKQVVFANLGLSRNRLYRIQTSSDARMVMTGGYAEVEQSQRY